MNAGAKAGVFGVLLCFFISGCSQNQIRNEPQIVALPSLPKKAPEPKLRQDRTAEFCGRMTQLVDQGRKGFAPLRGQPIEQGWRWQGAITPEPFLQCEIEGTVFPSANYRCETQGLRAKSGDALNPLFQQVQAQIEACLNSPAWYPREWRRGDLFEFAGGDKQLMWRDIAAQPAAAVVLAISEDVVAGRHHLELSIKALR